MSTFEIPWQSLVDAAPEGLFVLDDRGNVQYANEAALTLWGLPDPEGAPVARWLAHLGDLSAQLLLKTIEGRGQTQLYLPKAEHKYQLFEAEPLADTGGTLCRVRRDHAVEASELIAITAHELRIPMTSIMGYAKMLQTVGAESLNDMQKQFLATIDRNVQRLNSDLLAVQDMTRVDRATLRFEWAALAPAKVVTAVLQELKPLVEEKDHQVTVALPDHLLAVRADRQRFEQILRILLDNALKYTPSGGEIIVRAHDTDGQVQFDVVDSGLGISVAEQSRIFEKFFRGEDQGIRDYPGLGLNLYIARGLARLQGGELWFKSQAGEGSTFSFTLPIFQE